MSGAADTEGAAVGCADRAGAACAFGAETEEETLLATADVDEGGGSGGMGSCAESCAFVAEGVSRLAGIVLGPEGGLTASRTMPATPIATMPSAIARGKARDFRGAGIGVIASLVRMTTRAGIDGVSGAGARVGNEGVESSRSLEAGGGIDAGIATFGESPEALARSTARSAEE